MYVRHAHLWEVYAECIHVKTVEEPSKRFPEPSERLVHELEVHQIGFQVGDRICQLGKCRLKGVQWKGSIVF